MKVILIETLVRGGGTGTINVLFHESGAMNHNHIFYLHRYSRYYKISGYCKKKMTHTWLSANAFFLTVLFLLRAFFS